MNAHSIISTIKLTADERKAVKASQARLAVLPAIEDALRDPADAVQQGRASGLWDSICDTADAFVQEPSATNLDAHLAVLAKVDLVTRHRAALDDLGRRAVAAAQAPLAAVADAVLDRAGAELDRLATEGRPHAESAGLSAEHQAKVAGVRAELGGERTAAREWPGAAAWLANHGLID